MRAAGSAGRATRSRWGPSPALARARTNLRQPSSARKCSTLRIARHALSPDPRCAALAFWSDDHRKDKASRSSVWSGIEQWQHQLRVAEAARPREAAQAPHSLDRSEERIVVVRGGRDLVLAVLARDDERRGVGSPRIAPPVVVGLLPDPLVTRERPLAPFDGRTALGFPTRRKEHRFKMSFASFADPFRAKE